MRLGLGGSLRVALNRARAEWPIVAATWLMIVCATTLIALGVLYGDAVAITGLRRALAAEPPRATSIAVSIRADPEELEAVDDAVERQVGRVLGWTGGELVTVAQAESYALPDQRGSEVTDLALLGSYEGIERHAALDAGAWPEAGADPIQAAVSSSVAQHLGLDIGSELRLTSQRGQDRAVEVRIVGVWAPTDPADPYWRDALELEGVAVGSTFTTHGPLVVAAEDLVERLASGEVGLSYRALPRLDDLDVDDVGWMRSDAAAVERRLGEMLGDARFFQVDTRLPEILERVNRSLLVTRSGVVVLTIQFAVLAAYALLLVAGLVMDQRRVETALLRSRGAAVGHVALLSLLEAVILVAPAVLAAPWLASVVLGGLNVAGPLADAGVSITPRVDTATVVTAVAAGAVAVALLVAPALLSGRGLAAVRQSMARQDNRTIGQRLGFDLALVILAGVGLWQLRQYGAPLTQTVRGSVGLDPLLVAAPGIGLLAGAILALRIVPLAAELGERLLSRRAGLVAPLGARQLARRPLRYTRSALLLMLAAALGTFAGAYASTWTRSQADQAAYRTAADVRVTLSGFPDLPTWAMGPAYGAVDGVEAALPVARDAFDVEGSVDGTLLALDARAAPAHVAFRPDLASEPLGDLMARLTSEQRAAGVRLAEAPARFTARINAALVPVESEEAVPFPPSQRGIVAAVAVRDSKGLIHRIALERLALGGGAQTTEAALDVPETDVTLEPPIDVLGVILDVELPEDAQATGELTLEALEAVTTSGSVVSLAAAPVSHVVTPDAPINGFGPAQATRVDLGVGPPLEATPAIPALAGASYLAGTGLAVGDTIEIGALGERRTIRIVGSVGAFPTLDPATPFVVVDIGAFAASEYAAAEELELDEWWLATDRGRESAVADAVRAPPYSADEVVAYSDLHRELASDPIALGVIGALSLGALAAVIFAAIGFMVGATVSVRERLGEFALLQAIGLSHRQTSAWLTLENAFLVVVGLAAGTGLGLLLAWVVLPFVALTQEATVAVPPIDVVFPWGIYAALYAVALGVLGVTVLIVGGLLGRVRVSGVLRGGD